MRKNIVSNEYKKPLEDLVLVLFNAVRVSDVPNIRWDGKNDLYLEVEMHYSTNTSTSTNSKDVGSDSKPIRRFFIN